MGTWTGKSKKELTTDLTAEHITIRQYAKGGRAGDQPIPLQSYRSDEEPRQEVCNKLYGYEILRVDLAGIEILPIRRNLAREEPRTGIETGARLSPELLAVPHSPSSSTRSV